jgi:hypothetical protein
MLAYVYVLPARRRCVVGDVKKRAAQVAEPVRL